MRDIHLKSRFHTRHFFFLSCGAKSYHLPLAAELIIWWGNLIKQGKKETIRNQNKKGLTANSLDSVSVFPIISTMQC
jgi:hypothetical protein